MGALTTTTQVPDILDKWASRKLIMVAKPKLVHASVAQKGDMPQGNGRTAVYRKYAALATTGVVLAQLQETVPPAGEALSKSDKEVTLGQWGNYATLSDMVEYTVRDKLMRIAVERLGRQSGQVIDKLLRDKIVAGSQVRYGGGVASRALVGGTSSTFNTDDIRVIVRTLQRNDAEYFESMIMASTKIDTKPIRPSFVGTLHPDNYRDIDEEAGFIPVANYSAQTAVHPAEIGYLHHVRWLSTTHTKVWADAGTTHGGTVSTSGTNSDVYGNMVFAPNAVGDVPLQGRSMENIIHRRGSGGVGDPVNQRATVGWKHTGARLILEDLFLVRYECNATA